MIVPRTEATSLELRPEGPEMVLAHLAVAQKTGIPKWLALVSGNMDQNLRCAPPVQF